MSGSDDDECYTLEDQLHFLKSMKSRFMIRPDNYLIKNDVICYNKYLANDCKIDIDKANYYDCASNIGVFIVAIDSTIRAIENLICCQEVMKTLFENNGDVATL